MAPVVQLWGDLFDMECSLAHAVSRDLRMTAGIADDFRKLYGGVDELKGQNKNIGEVAYIPSPKSGFLFYLITKEKYFHKAINIKDVKAALTSLKLTCLSLGVFEVAMPRISCGLDLLDWNDVLPVICEVFSDCSIRVNVLTLPPCYRGMAVLGDSQALRFVRQHGTNIPAECHRGVYCKEVGLTRSGQRLAGLLEVLKGVPDRGLSDVLCLIGSNDLLDLSRSQSAFKLKNSLKGQFGMLRTLLLNKIKPSCRAVIVTIPPLPALLLPESGDVDVGSISKYRDVLNTVIRKLATPRFQVLDLDEIFMEDGEIVEDLFESVMGKDKREDRMHINAKGMELVKKAISLLPPFVFKP